MCENRRKRIIGFYFVTDNFCILLLKIPSPLSSDTHKTFRYINKKDA